MSGHLIKAIGKIGPPAASVVPILIRILKSTDYSKRIVHTEDNRKFYMDDYVDNHVIKALGQIGPKSAPAIPQLIKALKNQPRDEQQIVITALGQIGPKASKLIPLFVEILNKLPKDYARMRLEIKIAIVQMDPSQKLSFVKNAFKAKNYWNKERTAFALETMDLTDGALIQALLDNTHKAPYNFSKLRLLVDIDPMLMYLDRRYDQDPNLQALVQDLEDENWLRKRIAAEKIEKYGSFAASTAPALMQLLKARAQKEWVEMDEDRFCFIDDDLRHEWWAKEAAIAALKKFGLKAIPTLIQALKDKDKNARETAANILGEICCKENKVIVALQQATKDKDKEVCQAAHIALKKIRLREEK